MGHRVTEALQFLISRDQARIPPFQFPVQTLNLVLCPLPFSDVPRHFSKPAQSAFLIVQRGDHHVGPESRTVLAYAPALVFEPALFCRGLEFIGRLAFLDPLDRVETREMLAEDLLGEIPCDAFGPCTPTAYASLTVEHDNGVILHPRHQQAEPFLAEPQQILGPLAFRDIPYGTGNEDTLLRLQRA